MKYDQIKEVVMKLVLFLGFIPVIWTRNPSVNCTFMYFYNFKPFSDCF